MAHEKDRRTSESLQSRVEEALEVLLPWGAVRIGVSAKDSAVMLSGMVTTRAEHNAVIETALAAGATAIADHIEVAGDDSHPSDLDIAVSVHRAITHSEALHGVALVPTVRRGHVSLTGEAPSNHKKEAAAQVAHHVHGVVGVDNQIVVTTSANTREWA